MTDDKQWVNTDNLTPWKPGEVRKMTKEAKLLKEYEFTALIDVSLTIKAETEEQAEEQIKTYSAEGWIRNGEIIGLSDIDLINKGTHNLD